MGKEKDTPCPTAQSRVQKTGGQRTIILSYCTVGFFDCARLCFFALPVVREMSKNT